MSAENSEQAQAEGYVTVVMAGQLFGVKLECVRDVFVPQGLCPVPLAPPEVAGLLNLRGRIVTAIDIRHRLGLAPREQNAPGVAIGIEERGELYGLLADKAGDVMWLQSSDYKPNPLNLDPRWARVCGGVYRLERELLLVLDVDKVLDLGRFVAAA